MAKPLAARWRAHELPELRAGALASARVEVENAGETPWRGDRFTVSYHWLDDRGNAIVWDGLRTPITAEPGEAATVDVAIRAPMPPGRYRLAIDLVDESRFWFGEVGNATLDADADVLPRIDDADEADARLGNAIPDSNWGRLVLAAHREGYAVVGGSVETSGVLRRRPPELGPYTPPGRVPSFAHPLVCASVVKGVEVEWTEVAGLPAVVPPLTEPYLYDGRIRVRLPSGRRRG
jgi:hypothetical protein